MDNKKEVNFKFGEYLSEDGQSTNSMIAILKIETKNVSHTKLFDTRHQLVTDPNQIANFNAVRIQWQFYNNVDGLVYHKSGSLFDMETDDYQHWNDHTQYNGLLRFLNEFGQKYHLNDLKVGTPTQMNLIDQMLANGIPYDDDMAQDYLKEYDMLIDSKHNYKYGSSWICQQIDESDLNIYKHIIEKIANQEYEELMDFDDKLAKFYIEKDKMNAKYQDMNDESQDNKEITKKKRFKI